MWTPPFSSSALLVTTKRFCIYFQNELFLLLCTWISNVLLSLLTPNVPSRVSCEFSPAQELLSSGWAWVWCCVWALEAVGALFHGINPESAGFIAVSPGAQAHLSAGHWNASPHLLAAGPVSPEGLPSVPPKKLEQRCLGQWGHGAVH